jgi:hypothetical protein
MHLARTKISALALLTIAIASTTACGSSDTSTSPSSLQRNAPQDEEHDGPARSTSEKIIVQQQFVMTSPNLRVITNAMELWNSQLAVVGGQAVFTESSALAALQFPTNPDPAQHLTTRPVSNIRVDLPDPFPAAWASVTALSLVAIDVSMGTTSIDVTAKLTANVHVHTPSPLPDFDITVDSLDVVAPFRPYGGVGFSVSADDLTVKATHHVEGCDGFAWCVYAVEKNLPNIETTIHDAMLPAVNGMISSPEAQTAIIQVLNAFSNELVPPGDPKWSIQVPYGVAIADGALSFYSTRELVPVSPQNCQSSVLCSNAVELNCTTTADPFILQRAETPSTTYPGAWTTVSTDSNVTRQISPQLLDASPPTQGAIAVYRVCAVDTSDSLHTACTAPMSVTLSHGSGCAPTGGGGGITTCPLNSRMCNGRCLLKNSPCTHVE